MMEDKLVDDAKKAIDEVFSDQSVDRETTKDRLVELQDHIDVMLDTLD
jgi:hypothetical protein